MVKRVEGYFRPAALDQVLFNNYQNDKRPHISTLFHKGVYHALLARSVANINPVYAGFYGFLRGALDIPLAKAQEILCNCHPTLHHLQIWRARLLGWKIPSWSRRLSTIWNHGPSKNRRNVHAL